MAFYLLYVVLLVIWLPLLWPALRLKGGARVWLLVVTAAGLGASLYEPWMLYGTISAIRLDIPLIGIVLVGLYGTVAVVLIRAKWRKAAGLLSLVLILIGGGMAYKWVLIRHESKHLTEMFHVRNALLFDAKFRSRETYENAFGSFTAGTEPLPIGHWQAESTSNFLRLIVNSEGRAWLFVRCGATECPYGPADSGLKRVGEGPAKIWETTLEQRAVSPLAVRITQEDSDRLSIEIVGQPVSVTRTPPPIDTTPARHALVFLGTFSKLACRGQHADIRQLWLWREGAQLYAVGIFANRPAGHQVDYISPVVMGEGARKGDNWHFEWDHGGRAGAATVAIIGSEATLVLEQDGKDPERILLDGQAIIRDEAMDLAPLTTKADWDHWFGAVLIGHFSSGDIPAC